MVLVLIYAWLLPGCGRQDGVFYETGRESAGGTGSAGTAGSGGCGGSGECGASEDAAEAGQELADGSGLENDAGERQASDRAAGQNAEEDTSRPCYIHICGAVVRPGVYEVAEGSRLYEVIVLAGGLRADACDHLVNQAQTVSDGMQIYIPTLQDVQEDPDARGALAERGVLSGQDVQTEQGVWTGQTAAQEQDLRVDLNRATKEQLMTLPGVGETRAQAIIDYREENGAFAAIEDLMKVSGIKQGVYDRLKDLIRV